MDFGKGITTKVNVRVMKELSTTEKKQGLLNILMIQKRVL